MADELFQRGLRNIIDAHFVRDHFIPIALDQGRWNIAVYESHRAVELLVRGMTCLRLDTSSAELTFWTFQKRPDLTARRDDPARHVHEC